MDVPAHLILAIKEIASKLDRNASLEIRLKQAMREALNHWLVTDENEQFNCAIGAVLLTASQEEKDKINQEMRFLKALSAGIPVDWEKILIEMQNQKPIGLLRLWEETKNLFKKDKRLYM